VEVECPEEGTEEDEEEDAVREREGGREGRDGEVVVAVRVGGFVRGDFEGSVDIHLGRLRERGGRGKERERRSGSRSWWWREREGRR